MWETWVWSLGWEDPLEKGKATHSSIPAWRNRWTVQSMGSQRVGHDWATFTFRQAYSKNFMEKKENIIARKELNKNKVEAVILPDFMIITKLQ